MLLKVYMFDVIVLLEGYTTTQVHTTLYTVAMTICLTPIRLSCRCFFGGNYGNSIFVSYTETEVADINNVFGLMCLRYISNSYNKNTTKYVPSCMFCISVKT